MVLSLARTTGLFLLALLVPAIARADMPTHAPIHAGHSAMWYDRARSGEGWMLEILPDDGAVVYWFTFDDAGNPRWLGGVGDVVRGENGDEVRFNNLTAVHGPRFGPDYDPADAVRQHVGSATFRFFDCDTGEISFNAYGKQRTYPLTRLTRTMGANGCRPIHGTPGEPVQPYAGQSGSWYDPAFSGQGYSLAWLANGDPALVWFTFDSEGKPFWLTATGRREGERIVFQQLTSVRGGRFAEPFAREDVIRSPWGRLELSLECNTGEAEFFPTAEGFAEGELELRRLTRLESPACPWVKPKMTDLYEVAVTELPIEWISGMIEVGTPPPGTVRAAGERIAVHGVAIDGTVVGTGIGYRAYAPYYLPVSLLPGASRWENILGQARPVLQGGVFVSAAGDAFLVNPTNGDMAEYPAVQPVFVRDGEVTPMPDPLWPGYSPAYGVSEDLSFVVGGGLVSDGAGGRVEKPWRWNAEDGQTALYATEDYPGARAACVSNDGAAVIGSQTAWFPMSSPLGLRWAGGSGSPHLLFDASGRALAAPSACSGSADIVFGELATLSLSPQGEWSLVTSAPGFWTSRWGPGSGFLGALSATQDTPAGWPLGINDVSSDGTLAAGWYRSPAMAENPPSGWASASGALIWTQDTGHVLVSDLLAELEHPLDWPSMHVAAASPNGKYVLLTTGELRNGPVGTPSRVHSALLRLTRR